MFVDKETYSFNSLMAIVHGQGIVVLSRGEIRDDCRPSWVMMGDGDECQHVVDDVCSCVVVVVPGSC